MQTISNTLELGGTLRIYVCRPDPLGDRVVIVSSFSRNTSLQLEENTGRCGGPSCLYGMVIITNPSSRKLSTSRHNCLRSDYPSSYPSVMVLYGVIMLDLVNLPALCFSCGLLLLLLIYVCRPDPLDQWVVIVSSEFFAMLNPREAATTLTKFVKGFAFSAIISKCKKQY